MHSAKRKAHGARRRRGTKEERRRTREKGKGREEKIRIGGQEEYSWGGVAHRPYEEGKTDLVRIDWKERAKEIRLLLLDVDGVLTDGRIVYDGKGGESKIFDIKDGQGIKLLQQAGLKVGILSGRRSAAVRLRARELGIKILHQKALNKGKNLEGILKKNKVRAEQICFVGDDLADLPVLLRVGLAVAVADGVEEVRANAHYVTHHPGGRGAVREICELILKAQGKWKWVTSKYIPPKPFKPSS